MLFGVNIAIVNRLGRASGRGLVGQCPYFSDAHVRISPEADDTMTALQHKAAGFNLLKGREIPEEHSVGQAGP